MNELKYDKSLYIDNGFYGGDMDDSFIQESEKLVISRYGIDLRIRDGEACWVKDLDSQKEKKKQIFGGGYLLSESAAARKAEAEQAAGRLKAERETAATCWELSDRERGIIKAMERRSDK